MNSWVNVFNTNELLIHMIEYLPSRDILKLFLIKKNMPEDIIYEIYYKLYLSLQPVLKISLKNIKLLSHLTRQIIENGYKLKYSNHLKLFSTEEICIRKILFENVNSSNIISLYYLFYNYKFYSILSRFISDGIIISPYECSFNKKFYYGNEQTLRIALRFKQHNMIKQILSDVKYIATENNLKIFWFITKKNNILYESISNNDIEGFKIIINFIHLNTQPNFVKFIILQSSDTDSQLYNNVQLNNTVFHVEPNLLTHALKYDNYRLFNTWDWNILKPNNLSSNDFQIYIKLLIIQPNTTTLINATTAITKNKIVIKYSPVILNYINYQYTQIINHIEKNINNLKFVNVLDEYLNINNINIFNDNLLLTLLSQKNQYLFMVIYLIIKKNKDNFDIHHIYKNDEYQNIIYFYQNNGYQNNGYQNEYTIVEFLECLIYSYRNVYQNNINDFIQFINLLLIHKLFENL